MAKIFSSRIILRIMIFLFFFIMYTPSAHSGTVISEKVEWKAKNYVGFNDPPSSFPYSFTGPGCLQIKFSMSPYYCRLFYAKAESVLGYDADGWKNNRTDSKYDGKELSSFNVSSSCSLEGKVSSHTSFIEYQIPDKSFSGNFTLSPPVVCGLANCNRRAATATLEVTFIPGNSACGQAAGGTGSAVNTSGNDGKKTNPTGADQAECERRIKEIIKGSNLCKEKDWIGCRNVLEKALGGADGLCTGKNAEVLEKAKKLLSKAKTEAEKAGQVGNDGQGGSSGQTGTASSPCPSNATSMTLQACSVKGKPGETVTVPLWLLKGQNLANLNFDLRYDQTVANASGNATKGNFLGKALFASNLGEGGKARLGFAQSSGVSGSGQIAAVPFKITGKAGQRTALSVSVTTANAVSGSSVTVAALSGEIVVEGDGEGASTPTGATPTGTPTGTQKPGGDSGTTSTPGTKPTTTASSPKFTAMDALTALKMSVGLLSPDMKYDLDKNGQITSNDARLILMNVVGK